MTIEYEQEVNFEGRNGLFCQSGIEIFQTVNSGVVSLFPITSKKNIGRGMVQIPKSSIQDIIDVLEQLKS